MCVTVGGIDMSDALRLARNAALIVAGAYVTLWVIGYIVAVY